MGSEMCIRDSAEGETYFPYSPVLVVESDFAHGVILETLILSILNHDSAVASAASRMTGAAGSRPVIEMGSRRTHEESAVAAARAAATADSSCVRRLPISITGRDPAAPVIREAAEATAESWLRIERISVSRITPWAKSDSTTSTGE